MKRTLLGISLTFLICSAVFEDLESGARPDGMAGAFTAVANDASAIRYNPAGLSQVDRLNVYAFYKLLYGGLGDNLHNATLNAAFPLPGKAGTLGAALQEMGFSLSSERCLTVSHGFALVRDLYLGYGLSGYNVAMQDLGQAFAVGLDIGMLARIYKRWTIGFYAHNLNMPQIGVEQKTYLPRVLRLGMAYTPASGIVSSLDVCQEVGKTTRVAVGQEFEIIENYLTLRAGVQTEPVRLAFGLRTGTKNIRVDYGLVTHSDLPLTHDLGLSIVF